MLEIVKYPKKILRTRSRRVINPLTPAVQSLIKEMTETMLTADGVGLAANQVNQDIRVITINLADGPRVFINPFVYYKSFKKNTAEEGCLSLPGVFGLIKRANKINLIYRDTNGALRHWRAHGMLARVLQHEIDHLNGVLFIDKMIEYTSGEEQVKQWQKQADDQEK